MTRILQTDLARDALYTKVNQIADEKQGVLTAGTCININNDEISINPSTDTNLGTSDALVSSQNAVKTYVDNNTVSLTGTETITGVKTFASSIASKLGGTYANYASAQQNYMNIGIYDSTGKPTGLIDCYTDTQGQTETRLIAFNPNDSTTYSVISAKYHAGSGKILTYAPTPETGANDNNIATTAWVKLQGYVTSGTMFPNTTWVSIGDDAYIGDQNQSGSVCIKGITGNTTLRLFNRNETAQQGFYIDEADFNALKLINPTSGAIAWGSVTAMIGANPGSNGYIKFNHGLIIQWGVGSATNNEMNVQTITFPTPFTSTNYQISYGTILTTANQKCERMFHTQNKTTTSCEACCSYTGPTYVTTVAPTWIAIGY